MCAVLSDKVVVAIDREADIVVAQQRARNLAREQGFDLKAQWEIAIAVSEAAGNMFKYAGSGQIALYVLDADPPAIEFTAIDRGAGIADLDSALRDGVSQGRELSLEPNVTGRTGLGLGLGAIGRLMDELQIDSTPQGTCLRARRYRR